MLTSASAGTRLSWTPVEFWIRFTHIGGEILPHKVLATCSGCRRHEILERKWFGFRGGSGIRSTFQHGLKAQFHAKTHRATRAKLQPSSAHILLVKMDTGIPKHSDSKRYLCAHLVLRESDVDPQSCAVKSCDQNNILHTVEATTKVLRNLEADVNVFVTDCPAYFISPSYFVLLSRFCP